MSERELRGMREGVRGMWMRGCGDGGKATGLVKGKSGLLLMLGYWGEEIICVSLICQFGSVGWKLAGSNRGGWNKIW